VELAVSTLVDEFTHRLQVGVPPGNVGFNKSQHLNGGLVQTDEGAIVDLTQTQQLQDLADPGADTVDTTDSYDEAQFGLVRYVEVVVFPGDALQSDGVTLLSLVLLDVLLGALENNLPLGGPPLLLE